MRTIDLTLPELSIIAGSRAILGAGIGLLVADHLPRLERKTLGWSLFIIGAVITVPLAFELGGQVRGAFAPRRPVSSQPFA